MEQVFFSHLYQTGRHRIALISNSGQYQRRIVRAAKPQRQAVGRMIWIRVLQRQRFAGDVGLVAVVMLSLRAGLFVVVGCRSAGAVIGG